MCYSFAHVLFFIIIIDRPQFMDSSETLDSDDSQINLLILGSGGFAQAMENEIRVRNQWES